MRLANAMAWMSLVSLVPTVSGAGNDVKTMPRVEVTEPKNRVVAKEGKPIRIRWQIRNRPANLQDWILEVAVDGCVFGSTRHIVYSERLDDAATRVDWIPTKDYLEWVDCDGDCAVPVLVRLMDMREDHLEYLQMHTACKCVPTSGWLVSASSPGLVDLEAAAARARAEAGGQ